MKKFIRLLIQLICGSLILSVPANGQDAMHVLEPKLVVTVEKAPTIKLERDLRATPAEAAEIKEHIANLRKIAHPDYGFCSTMTGTMFAPIDSSVSVENGILEDPQVKSSDDVRALVALGPKALPFLLASLSDSTPTRLTIKQPISIMGGMFFSDETDANPANAEEQKAVSKLPKISEFANSVETYKLTVGDICYTIIGEIVGRNYLALRYQPTAIVVINSPTHCLDLAKQIQTAWSSTNAAQTLLDSFLLDYSTKFTDGAPFGVQSVNRRLQPGAAMRLLYYFPQETAGMIADRLAALDVTGEGENFTNFFRRETFNEVETEDFIKAVSWSDTFEIRKAILDIFKRTTDPDLLLAALPGIYPSMDDLVQARLEYFIDLLPPEEKGSYGHGYYLLVALGERFGEQAKPTFIRYMKNAGPQRKQTMTEVLKETHSQWASELLH